MSNTNKSTKKALLLRAAGRLSLIIVGGLLLITSAYAETDGWNTEVIDDGTITVRSKISDRVDENGESIQLIEYMATTIASVKMSDCISVIKNVSNHKVIRNDEVSKIVDTISDNEWVVYYYTNSPWPMPDNDCVAIMKFEENEQKQTATFWLNAAPSIIEKKEVDRITYYEAMYSFEDLGNDQVELSVSARMSPTIQAPSWMIKGCFPKGPADVLRKIIKLARNS